MPVDPETPDPAALAEAVGALRSGGLVAFPTETLYALGADPFHPGALERVFAAKGREAAKAVSLLLARAGMVDSLAAPLPPLARDLMERFWPGPLTLIVRAIGGLPPGLAASGGGIGLRVPRNAVALALLGAFGGPLVGTSANRAGGPDPRDAGAVLRQVGPSLALLLDGGLTPIGSPSSVVDCTEDPPRLLRAGALPLAVLQAVVPSLVASVAPPKARK
ncbi:MAG TPA: L-threonylcarbamoyladenylate synthase [Candidatus Methylomirabilis sp.]